jgi:hypothetical protein
MIAGLRAEQWQGLSANERLGALQNLEIALAARDGRNQAAVQSFMGQPGERGFYDERTNTIFINEALYNSGTGQPAIYGDDGSAVSADKPYMAVETLFHENRHAYQHYVAAQRPDLAEDRRQLDDFQKNVGPAYIQPEENSLKYACQPTEMDARQAARQEADQLYADDPDYQAHRDHMVAEEQGTAELADLYLGDDYEETVRQEVYARYEASLARSTGASVEDLQQETPAGIAAGGYQQEESGESETEVLGEMPSEGLAEGGADVIAGATAQEANAAGTQTPAEANAPTAAQASSEGADKATEEAVAQSPAKPVSEEAAPAEEESEAETAGETTSEPSEGYDYYSGYGY